LSIFIVLFVIFKYSLSVFISLRAAAYGRLLNIGLIGFKDAKKAELKEGSLLEMLF
jgi:hypothetical protein